MSNNNQREEFLKRVRQAVQEGNQVAGGSPPLLPERGSVGYQGAGPDPVARLRDELTAAGGFFHLARSRKEVIGELRMLLARLGARRVLLGDGALLESLALRQALSAPDLEVQSVSQLADEDHQQREVFFAADVGISGADHLIAETGTVVLETRRDQPRSLSLLAPVHVVIADESVIRADLFDLFEVPAALAFSRDAPAERAPPGESGSTLPVSGGGAGGGRSGSPLPSCLTLITGPSKTGDIELKLVTGVHGPAEVHLILLAPPAAPPHQPGAPVS